MNANVECHSGFAYAERPVAFNWQDERLVITALLSQTRIPEGRRFVVRTEDGQEFELLYLEKTDEWKIQQP